MLLASYPLPSRVPVTLFTTDTKKLLMKNPSERVVRKSPVLIVLIPFGDYVMKKSSWPVYMKASPDPTKKNWGINMKTLVGNVPVLGTLVLFATESRFPSAIAATAMPSMERRRPIHILCKLVNPVKENKIIVRIELRTQSLVVLTWCMRKINHNLCTLSLNDTTSYWLSWLTWVRLSSRFSATFAYLYQMHNVSLLVLIWNREVTLVNL